MNMRILIAEDDFASRILLEAVLTKWGYEVIVANDGAAAWQILDTDDAPPIAILDWMMPKLSGIELCERVRNRGADLSPYIVMLTARGEKSDVGTGLDAGADDYLTKPFDLTELSARLRVARRSITLQRELIQARKQASYQALHDAPTGALNRGAILSGLSESMAPGQPLTIALFQLDAHKQIQEAHGAAAAENAVRQLVEAIRSEAGAALIGRYSKDELLVIFRDRGASDVVEVAERVRGRFAESTRAGGERMTFSCGISNWDGGANMELLLCYSDTALYAARGAGDAIEVFNWELAR